MSGLEQEAMMSSLMLDKLDKIKVRILFIFILFFVQYVFEGLFE
jgi:hypothetical protein